ncbi:MAG: hypothetical protein Q9211_000121 [Gyalolechia sp. 1 TL-2023]
MKERITFVQPPAGDFSPEQLAVSTDALQVKSLKAAREDRLTFGVEELPHQVRWSITELSSAASTMGL